MTKERLYDFLPRIYRQKDLDRGQPLRALMAVLESEYRALEQDIDALYDNWFIETCDEWCIPYIGDLIGVRDLVPGKRFPGSWRALVANTIAYRRRKGTILTLTDVSRDATGWQALAVEFFQLLSSTQTLKHLRLEKGKTINLKDSSALARINTPFDTAAHTIDLRGCGGSNSEPAPVPDLPRGKYNIPNIGIFLWRLQCYPIVKSDAKKINEGYFTFNPFGLDMPLFNLPETPRRKDEEPTEENLPVVLDRQDHFFPAFQVFVKASENSDYKEMNSWDMRICNLEQWRVPNRLLFDESARAAIDPQTGRIVFLHDFHPAAVKVSYSYGFSGDIGGGPYSRLNSAVSSDDSSPWTALISKSFAGQTENQKDQEGPPRFPTIADALQAWAENGKQGIIRIIDSSTYESSAPQSSYQDKTGLSVGLEGQEWLVIEAADGQCPCIIGNLVITGANPNSRVDLNGLWIDSTITVSGGFQLTLSHCTLKPQKGTDVRLQARPAILADHKQTRDLQVFISHSITGPLLLHPNILQLQVEHSIIDGLGGYAISAPQEPGQEKSGSYGPPTQLEKTTLLGSISVTQLMGASDVLFTNPVTVKDSSTGFVRYSFIPEGSHTPVRYQCHTQQQEYKSFFTSINYGHPAYGQLGSGCPTEIKTGAENGAEIGAFNFLYQPQREANLQDALEEYFPYGLKPEVFYVT